MFSFLQESFARTPLTTSFVLFAAVMTVISLFKLLYEMKNSGGVKGWQVWVLVVFLGYSLYGGLQVAGEYQYWSQDVRCQLQRKKRETVRNWKRYWFWCQQGGVKRKLPVSLREYGHCHRGFRLQKSKRSFRLQCAGSRSWLR